jgi:alpha-tubulin suppressor-like RCC1 family protein
VLPLLATTTAGASTPPAASGEAPTSTSLAASPTKRADEDHAARLLSPLTSVTIGDPADLVIRLSRGSARPVRLQERRDGRWRTIERTTTRIKGAVFDWSPARIGIHRLRGVAPRVPEHPRWKRVVTAKHLVYGAVAQAPVFDATLRQGLPRSPIGTPYLVDLSQDTPHDGLLWSVDHGRLPDGIVLDPRTGLLAGAATGPHGLRFPTFRVVDEEGRAAWMQRKMWVQPTPDPVMTTDLAPAQQDQEYVDAPTLQELRVGRWQVVRGALPDGLALDPASGLVIGVPSSSGTSTFRVRFTEVTGRVTARDDEIVVVADGGTGWASLRSVNGVTCGIQLDDRGWCWGGVNGGATTGAGRPDPHPQRLDGRWSSIDTDGSTTCGVSLRGGGFCWGSDVFGALGDGPELVSRALPQRLPGTWKEIDVHEGPLAIGGTTVCGLRTDDTLWCWGWDRYAESGDGSGGRIDGQDDVQPVPHQIPGRFGALPLGDANTHCAIELDGTGWCWGANDTGQVGNGQVSLTVTGVAPARLEGTWTSIVASNLGPYAGMTCGVRTDLTGWCWGENRDGSLGTGTLYEATATPTQLPGAWTSITPSPDGSGLTCGLRPDDSAACWGANYAGGVGDGTREDHASPYDLEGRWSSLETSGQTTCGVRTDATGWCWGNDTDGAVGDGDRRVYPATPFQLAGTWTTIVPRKVSGAVTTCGVRTDSSGWCWGADRQGRTGTGGQASDPVAERLAEPVQVAGSWQHIVQASTSRAATCGISPKGVGSCWGQNDRGAVGTGTRLDRSTPYVVVAGTD